MNAYALRSIQLHRERHGAIETRTKIDLNTPDDVALAYTPGIGAVASFIASKPEEADVLTWRGNTVAVVSDGSAVLGLGNIGPDAALPVMEGKCAIFRRFADIDAIPIVLGTQDTDEIVRTVQALEPSFGAIQLEDISAPRCFEIERRLHETMNIPVLHDDQHGTAIVVLAALMNALTIVGKQMTSIKIVINGAGAAGMAIATMLIKAGAQEIICCDRLGALWKEREQLNTSKALLATMTNRHGTKGSLTEVIREADVVIGVSAAGAFSAKMIRSMAPHAIVFALANPVPEIHPDEAKAAGAVIVATGRGDYPNQVNNALCYPGLFRGMLDGNIRRIDDAIKMRAARAIADAVDHPSAERIIPSIFDADLVKKVAASVRAR